MYEKELERKLITNKKPLIITQNIHSGYLYRDILIDSVVRCHYLNCTDNIYERNIHCTYNIDIIKNSILNNNKKLNVLNENLDYISEVIKVKLLNLCKDSNYVIDHEDDFLEFSFNRKSKSIEIRISYKVLDKIITDHKNDNVIQIIIDLLLDNIEELL